MGYFGGLGAGKGWHHFSFLVSPDELRELLEPLPIRLYRIGGVPVVYGGTSLEEFIFAYAHFVEACCESVNPDFRIVSGAKIDLVPHGQTIIESPSRDPNWKLTSLELPAPYLDTEGLSYSGSKGQLHSNVGNGISFGMRCSFPRVVSFDSDRHETLHDTERMVGYRIYLGLQQGVRKISRPIKIQSPTRIHRPAIRISPSMIEVAKRHAGLRAAGLQVLS